MEKSPLRFLDYDVSLMLADQVRESQENEAKKFHSDLFESAIDTNKENHYMISDIFDDITKIIDFLSGNNVIDINQSLRSVDVSVLKDFYESLLQGYLENIELGIIKKRCRF